MEIRLTGEMQIFIGVFIFMAGLCIGSFLNVCIFRVPEGRSVVFPPSGCGSCRNKLQARDMIPVLSYILLKGKCRYCNSPISVQYPLVELLTGIVWLVLYMRFGLSVELAALAFLFSILIAVFFIDLKHMIIPNGMILIAAAGGVLVVVYNIFQPFRVFQPSFWYTPLIGMVSASGILFVIALIGLLIYKNDGAMGMGDVKLFIPIGMFLGWKLSLLTLFVSVMLGGITGIFLLIFKIKDRKSAIPFGPFIVAASFAAVLFGNQFLS
jgi:leader peptidase (prepilin peptidase)/N-methyltransferase